MNYNPNQHPQDVNNRIQNYIDTVMHLGCTKPDLEKDKWTVDKIVYWQSLIPAICGNCYDHCKKLEIMISEFKENYDRHYNQLILGPNMEYRNLPYYVKTQIESLGPDIYPFMKGKWTDTIRYEAGELVFNHLKISAKWETSHNLCKGVILDTHILKAELIINNWNICVLMKRINTLESTQ